MVTRELAEAAVEINSIFSNMSIDLLDKIPLKLRDFFKDIESKEYKFQYDKSKKLKEQNLLPKTKGIIALIYRDYLCSDIEKENYNNEYNKMLLSIEQEKQEKYNSDNIFTKKDNFEEKIQDENLPIENTKISLFKKIFLKIKNYFNR